MLKGMPSPAPDPDTQPFWDGCAAGRLLVPRCQACGETRWPPGPMCPNCQSVDTEWIESTGRGRLYSWVTVVHPAHEVLVDQVPYVVGLIDLEEGVRVVGNVVGCSADEVVANMALEMFMESREDGLQLPNFRTMREAN